MWSVGVPPTHFSRAWATPSSSPHASYETNYIIIFLFLFILRSILQKDIIDFNLFNEYEYLSGTYVQVFELIFGNKKKMELKGDLERKQQ